MKFKPIYNKEGNFSDYVLTYVSNSFVEAVGINPELILNKKFSEIVLDIDFTGFFHTWFESKRRSPSV